MYLLCMIVQVYLVVCILRVIFSWIPLDPASPFQMVQTLAYFLTEPAFASVRKVVPPPGDLPLDLAPIIVTFGLVFVRQIVC